MSGLGLNLGVNLGPLSLSANVGLGFPLSVNVEGGIGGVANTGLATVSGSPQGQIFATRALSNSNTVYYTLAIIDPNSGQPVQTYIFPLSPNNIVKEFTAMTNTYDVSGPAAQNGVTRIADVFGNTPPTFMIRGTTGWQYHSTDGYSYTGLDSIQLLQSALNQFAQLNAQQVASGSSDLYTLEFYDYFTNSFWQVVPMGPQRIEQTSDRPLLFEYTLRLVSIKDLSSGPTQTQASKDDLPVNDVAGDTTSLGKDLTNDMESTISDYGDSTLGIV